jgi:cysteinyl-tRNA synthetase
MKIYNTMTGSKEDFVPQENHSVKMYVCGVTPYDNSHFGHAMSYIFFDVIRRYLKYRGYTVKYVQNVTDIDDKIINRANQRGITPADLAEKYTASFFSDMQALNLIPADVNPRATQEIPKIIEVIQGLVAKDYAYRTSDGSVYFRVTRDKDYGQLSHRTLDSMLAGARIEIGENKEHPMDFALWKASKPGEPAWDSPWGKGRPGWHIECTAMSMRYLGEQIDIHGGGQDLIFPHHENEIAQSESFSGKKPFVKYWMHNGFLQIGEEKMSKSLGNMLTIKEVLAKRSPDAVRVFVLSSHYRSPLCFTWEGLEGAEKGAERLARAANREDFTSTGPGLDVSAYQQQFIEAMDDDFNSAKALGILFDLARDINQAADSGSNITEACRILQELSGNVLGMRLPTGEAWAESVEAAPFIELLIKTRYNLRQAKQYQMADDIRTRLAELGILLEDTSKGTVWRQKK